MTQLPKAKKLDIDRSTELTSLDNSKKIIERLPDDVLIKRLEQKASGYLKSAEKFNSPHFLLEEESPDVEVISSVPTQMVSLEFEKLFEGAYLEGVEETVGKYMMEKIVGYNDYFSAPAIIIRDTKSRVVDIIQYRPTRDGYENLPKYLQEKSENKPLSRGADFLYPFQKEMEILMKKEEFAFVGEGIKNAVNALVRSVPYISIESASNVRNSRLIDYINNLFSRGITVYGAMDGDSAGEKAFVAINEKMTFPMDNLLDFNSGLDFTDYIRKEKI